MRIPLKTFKYIKKLCSLLYWAWIMKPPDTDRSSYCFYLLSQIFDALEGKIIAWQTPGLKSQYRALTMTFNKIQYLSYVSELLDMTLQSLPLKESLKPPSNTSYSWRELFRGSYGQVPWHFRAPAAAGMQQAGTEAKECFPAGSLTPTCQEMPSCPPNRFLWSPKPSGQRL